MRSLQLFPLLHLFTFHTSKVQDSIQWKHLAGKWQLEKWISIYNGDTTDFWRREENGCAVSGIIRSRKIPAEIIPAFNKPVISAPHKLVSSSTDKVIFIL